MSEAAAAEVAGTDGAIDPAAADTETTERSRGLAGLVGRGVVWSTLDVAIGRVAQFAQGVVVARLLAPEAFGVFAVALVVHSIVVNVSDLGVSAALVRDTEDELHRGAPTVATIALGSGLLLGGAMALSAPWLAGVLGSPDAASSVAVLALTLPLAGLAAVPSALARRAFRMDRLFVANLANVALTGVLVIGLAIAGWGPLALAWSWVAGQLAGTLVLLAHRSTRVAPGWSRLEARRLLRFGLPLAGANVVVFVVLNVDYVVVGRALGATALGLYVLAFNISGWPVTIFGSVIRNVSLPGFARLRLDGADLSDRFVTALGGVARATVPICFVLGALGQPLVLAVYGSAWSEASAALVGLSVMGAARLVIELSADYLVSLGRTRAVLLLQLPWLLGLVAALVVAVNRDGIAGAGAAQAIVAAGLMVPLYLVVLRRTGVAPSAVLRALAPAVGWGLVAAGVAAALAGAVSAALDDSAAEPFVAALVGGLAALVVVAVANRVVLRSLFVHLGERSRRRAEARGPTDREAIAAALDSLEGTPVMAGTGPLGTDPHVSGSIGSGPVGAGVGEAGA